MKNQIKNFVLFILKYTKPKTDQNKSNGWGTVGHGKKITLL